MQALRAGHGLSDLLRAAGLARSTLYYHLARREVRDKYAGVKALITSLFHEHKGRYGYRRLHCLLRKRGWTISAKTVRRLMSAMHLKSPVRRKKYRSWRGVCGREAENILQRNFRAGKPCEKWVTDVSEFNVRGQKLYLSPVLDLFNGEIVAWAVSRSPAMELVSRMMKKALKRLKGDEKPLIHSDRGWHYQMKSYQRMLEKKGLRQSMSRKGNCLDNAVMENFFGHLKAEMYHRREYEDTEELEKDIRAYIRYWNQKRIKLGLGGLSPAEYRAEYQKSRLT